jgi:hypothetical protein
MQDRPMPELSFEDLTPGRSTFTGMFGTRA